MRRLGLGKSGPARNIITGMQRDARAGGRPAMQAKAFGPYTSKAIVRTCHQQFQAESPVRHNADAVRLDDARGR